MPLFTDALRFFLMSDYYFAYGSNMNPQRMRARGLHFAAYQAGSLRGYTLSFNKRAHNKTGIAYANISYRQGDIVEGVLYALSPDSPISVMDPFEGTPVRYSRELFPVETDGGVIWAWVYVANPAYIADALQIEENYLAHLLSAGDLISEDYRARLSALESVVPSDKPTDATVGLRFNV